MFRYVKVVSQYKYASTPRHVNFDVRCSMLESERKKLFYFRDHPFSTYARGEGGGGHVNAYESVQGGGEGVTRKRTYGCEKISERF